MKVYISTPINGRDETTIVEKLDGARQRVEELESLIRTKDKYKDAELISTFDSKVNAGFMEQPECDVLARCIRAVLQCDVVFFDIGYLNSKGCMLEYYAAKIYGKKIILYGDLF